MAEDLAGELAALKAAYRSGALEVVYEGKRLRYDSEEGLRRRIAFIEDELASASGKRRPVAGFVSFRRPR